MVSLAQKLGETQHISPLQKKMERLGFSCLEDLKALGVLRGCRHYKESEKHISDPGREFVSDEELGIALLLGCQDYDPRAIRIGVQLISRSTDPGYLYFLCKKERCVSMLSYVVQCAKKIETMNPFWQVLDDLIKKTFLPGEGVLPHCSRFVKQTGISNPFNESKKKLEWIR